MKNKVANKKSKLALSLLLILLSFLTFTVIFASFKKYAPTTFEWNLVTLIGDVLGVFISVSFTVYIIMLQREAEISQNNQEKEYEIGKIIDYLANTYLPSLMIFAQQTAELSKRETYDPVKEALRSEVGWRIDANVYKYFDGSIQLRMFHLGETINDIFELNKKLDQILSVENSTNIQYRMIIMQNQSTNCQDAEMAKIKDSLIEASKSYMIRRNEISMSVISQIYDLQKEIERFYPELHFKLKNDLAV